MALTNARTPWSRVTLRLFTALTWGFLILPIAVLFPISFSSGSYLAFPPPGYSLKWYVRYLEEPGWVDATLRSLGIGAATAVASLAIGIPLALGLVRGQFIGRRLLEGGISAPIVVPHIVYSISVYGVFASLGLIGEWYGVTIAHTVLALPFVSIVLTAGLRDLDASLELAARGLGASQFAAFRHITLPLLAPSLISAAFMGFITSFDELVVAMFLAGTNMTLPKLLFDTILTGIEPTVAAASVIQIVIVTLALLISATYGRSASLVAKPGV